MSLPSLIVNNLGYLNLFNLLRNSARALAVVTLTLSLAACGGGSGSSDDSEDVVVELPDNNGSDNDDSGNTADITAPVITINSPLEITVEFGSTFTEIMATALDDIDGTITVSVSGEVNTSLVGTYTLTYTATDSSGNTSTENITVNVIDTTAPVITLIGDADVNAIQNNRYGKYNEIGATAFDNVDGEIDVVVTGEIDHSAIDTYTITYTATDSSNNVATKTRTVNVVEQTPFITVWDTNPAGSSNFSSSADQIIIGTDGSGYKFTVDWGDGTIEENLTGNTTHTYSAEGEYTVKITGEFPGLYFESKSRGFDNDKLLSVEQWGNNPWQSMEQAFYTANQVTFNATDAPDLSQVTNMAKMFYDCRAFNSDIGHWDVSNVTNMSDMFEETNSFNQDISAWDVSSVTNMSRMFKYAGAFNQNINDWDVSNVTDMSYMFADNDIFNQPLNDWDVSNVTDMEYMFNNAEVFNQELSEWDVSNVTNMLSMFEEAIAFNQNINEWDVSSVTTMQRMFYKAIAFNQDISQWDTASLINVSNMFNQAWAFDQNLGEWDMSNATDVNNMLLNVTLSITNYDALLNGWSTQILHKGLEFRSNATFSAAGYDARQYLIDFHEWDISDGES